MTATPGHVLVTDASRGSALAFIRSLGARGWRVTAADTQRGSAGFRSRYTTARLVYPSPTAEPDAAVEAIRQTVVRTGVDLVIPVTDELGLPLAAARDAFDGVAVLALPDPDAMGAVHDKIRTLDLAGRLGVPVPPSRRVAADGDVEAAARELGYPLVVKPSRSRELRADGRIDAFAVSYAGDREELEQRLAAASQATSILLQRWLPGRGLGVELLMHEGRPLAAFQHERLREVPVTGGASSLRVSVPLDADLYGHAVRILEALRWTGLAMVEFRRGPDGTAHLMEINGRVWGSLPLAVRAGMDFPARLADLLMAGPPADPAVATDYRLGLRARNLRLDLAWIGAVLRGRRRYPYLPWPGRVAGVRAAIDLLDPRIADDHFARSDIGPGFAQVGAIVSVALGRGAGRG